MERPIKAIILGCSGLSLTSEEVELFHRENPLGLILFSRNIQTPEQLRHLTDSFRKCVGRPNAPVLVDQEGGRVQRLKAPYWNELPSCKTYGELFRTDRDKAVQAVQKHAKALAQDLLNVGINFDCWPCLDIETGGMTDAMFGRCFSDNYETVLTLGQIAVDTLLKAGLNPIIKHIPGYGRATVDPHKHLPIVTADLSLLEKTDFYPFQKIRSDVWGMSSHVIYTALDRDFPATLSKTVISYIRHQIGFDGFLISDDIGMDALSSFGNHSEIACRTIQAGCDAVLYCNGSIEQMSQATQAVPYLSEMSLNRLHQAEKIK